MMADIERDDDWQITYEQGSPNDPILHGARWRRERDEARAEVERKETELAELRQSLAQASAQIEDEAASAGHFKAQRDEAAADVLRLREYIEIARDEIARDDTKNALRTLREALS